MNRLFGILLLGVALLSGCGGRPVEQKTTIVNIAFQPWIGYGIFYLAQEKGFCKEEGFEPNFIDEQLDSARRDALKAGMLDVEAGTLDLLVSKADQDTPVVMVMELDQSNGADAIIAAENIKTLEDLDGKRIALAPDDVDETFLLTLFLKKGLSSAMVRFVPKRVEDVAQAFLNDEADACATFEPYVTEALKKPGSHILASTHNELALVIDTLNVRKDLVDHNPALVKKIMRAWFKALAYYKAHPVEASGIIAKYYGITPEEYRRQVEGLHWKDHEEQKTQTKAKEWAEIFDAISTVKLANGRISQKLDPAKFINHALLKELYEDSK